MQKPNKMESCPIVAHGVMEKLCLTGAQNAMVPLWSVFVGWLAGLQAWSCDGNLTITQGCWLAG